MAKSFDKQLITNNDDIIRSVLKTELASITASEKLALDTISKCQAEFEKQKPVEPKTKLFFPRIARFGAPLVAGLLILVLVLNVPGTFDSKMFSSAPAASAENGKDVDDYDAAYGLLSETGSMTSGPLMGEDSPAPEEAVNNFEDEAGILTRKEHDAVDSGPLSITSLQQQEADEFSVFLGNLFISLNQTGTEDFLSHLLMSVLGPANNESVSESSGHLDQASDTTVKTLEYDGIKVVVSGAETYYIRSIEITDEKYTTVRGITVGMSVEDLVACYDNISVFEDSEADSNNSAYIYEENLYFIRFEVSDGLITSIRLHSENQ